MGNELGLLVPGMRSSGNTAKVAQKLGTGKLEKRKPMDYTYKGESQKATTREMLLRYAICSFKKPVCLRTIIFQPTTPNMGFHGQHKTTAALRTSHSTGENCRW